MAPFVRSAYNYDADMVSEETGLACPAEESKTQQNQKDEADINTIVRRFGLTGELPPNIRPPQYGDFTDVQDYHSALTAVRKADTAFMAFPAHIRARFNNDAGQYIEFMLDPNNRDEAEKLGLVAPSTPVPAPPAPAQTPVAEPAQAAS